MSFFRREGIIPQFETCLKTQPLLLSICRSEILRPSARDYSRLLCVVADFVGPSISKLE